MAGRWVAARTPSLPVIASAVNRVRLANEPPQAAFGADWENDLKHDPFYDGRFDFPWPRTEKLRLKHFENCWLTSCLSLKENDFLFWQTCISRSNARSSFSFNTVLLARRRRGRSSITKSLCVAGNATRLKQLQQLRWLEGAYLFDQIAGKRGLNTLLRWFGRKMIVL